jgi:hypothetical protein
MKRFVVYSFFLLLISPAAAAVAPMSRVVAIIDSHTIVVERARVQTTIRLAGVDVPPDTEEAARQFLARELLSRWVLIDPAPNGASYVWRSPDSLAVNRAVVALWLDGPSTHTATLLGWSMPNGVAPKTKTAKPAKPPKAPKASPPRARAKKP